MSRWQRRAARWAVQQARRRIDARPGLRDLVYDGANGALFTDLQMHEMMVADDVRVSTYAAGIARHVRPGDVVVDVGTGTGILAMLAARQGATVHAVDHSPFIEVAERLARANGIDTITFHRTNSRDLDLGAPVDVILHEQMGEGLFEENLVVNLLDLKQRLLRPGGRILPARFGVALEPVSLHPDHRVPELWRQEVAGLRFDVLRDDPALDDYRRTGYGNRLDASLRHAIDSHRCEPEPLLTLDLDELTSPDAVPTTRTVERTVTRAGRLDGFCLSFVTRFDDEIGFDTSPRARHTHWRSRLFRADGRHLEAGDQLRYTVDLHELIKPHTWQVHVEDAPVASPAPPAAPRAVQAAPTL
ncbi:methyltransferase domain-containing protein [Nitriliruptoraceae bacterium ZYF776]|nr:methyltransferase domain-containing protein [Profundirhabdus halotolerans]